MLLGINGAGKTTLLRILAGELQPHGSRRGLDEMDALSISYVPQFFAAIQGFTVLDYVSYVAWLNGQNWKRAGRQAPEWIEFIGIGELSGRKCTELSGGQQAKVQLASALNSNADLLLLDEPSASLDPLAKMDLLDIYEKIIDAGIGLWVSTHQPHEVSDLFSRVIVLHEGTVRFDGPIDEFQGLSGDVDADPVVVALAKATGR